MLVAGAERGRAGIRDLLGRVLRWKVDLKWYAAAIGLPLALVFLSMGINLLLGESTRFGIGDFSPVSLLLALIIVGEEFGWRGFALPRMLERRGALPASVELGALWAAWHLPNFLTPGYPQHGRPFPLFLLTCIAYSILFTWIFRRTSGSVLLAILFHASINLFSPTGVALERQDALELAAYGTAALLVSIPLSLGRGRGEGKNGRHRLLPLPTGEGGGEGKLSPCSRSPCRSPRLHAGNQNEISGV